MINRDGTIKVWDAGVGTCHPPTLNQNLTAPVLAAASLELKAEKQSAHSEGISSVAFSPDGATIISGSYDKTIKVWDANPRPFDASEWEEVDISGMEKDDDGEVEIEGLGYVGSNYWRNKVTGGLRKEYSTAGARLDPRTAQSLGCRCAGTATL